MNLVRAYLLDVYDGAMSPDDLAFGRTWPGRERCDNVYDRGANLGQFIGRW